MAERENQQPTTVIDLLNDIKKQVGKEQCVFRGEPRIYKRITSSLYRELRPPALPPKKLVQTLKKLQTHYSSKQELVDEDEVLDNIRSELNNLKGNPEERFESEEEIGEILRNIQKQDAINVKKRAGVIKSDSEALADIQHNGGQTNLIDFTESYLVALFFACWDARHSNKNGRLVALSKESIDELSNSNDENMSFERMVFIRPLHDNRRALVQYSVMLHIPEGHIEYNDEKIKAKINIPYELKPDVLSYLKSFCNISDETLFPDTLGYVGTQKFTRRNTSDVVELDQLEHSGAKKFMRRNMSDDVDFDQRKDESSKEEQT